MRFFRVKTGYGKDDFIGIDETELSKAIRSQVKGSVVIFKEGSVAGNSILSIKPDWQRVMGYHRDYDLVGEDYEEIGKKRQDDYRLFIENTTLAIEGKPPKEIPKEISEAIKKLSEKFSIPPTK